MLSQATKSHHLNTWLAALPLPLMLILLLRLQLLRLLLLQVLWFYWCCYLWFFCLGQKLVRGLATRLPLINSQKYTCKQAMTDTHMCNDGTTSFGAWRHGPEDHGLCCPHEHVLVTVPRGKGVLRVSGASVRDTADRHYPSWWCIQPVRSGTGLTPAHNQRSFDTMLLFCSHVEQPRHRLTCMSLLREAKLKFHIPSHSLAGRWICGRTEFATRAPNSLPQRLHLKLAVTR